ncbi:hypothetical protein BT96DRAFT_960403 [Gymnopus androsaceus JB14]|uniref:NADP-dependent oxidoreductase domain-containing protein n=1 Tax=Gymnopus androsaceus JB14 TaxID=1447944 RepID=A0A6A4GQB1_9AGAR|nr:hypothetical protein BT96DRAFT_960403 [Gymnopus androsaceus JB14]
MCAEVEVGLALAPWSVLAAGRLRTDEEEERHQTTGENGHMIHGNWERTEDEVKMSRALEKVAKDIGKTPYVFPILGGRKVENLVENLEALNISISDEQIEELESVIPFDVGFPVAMLVSSYFVTTCNGS